MPPILNRLSVVQVIDRKPSEQFGFILFAAVPNVCWFKARNRINGSRLDWWLVPASSKFDRSQSSVIPLLIVIPRVLLHRHLLLAECWWGHGDLERCPAPAIDFPKDHKSRAVRWQNYRTEMVWIKMGYPNRLGGYLPRD
jgi:hypothetical protein